MSNKEFASNHHDRAEAGAQLSGGFDREHLSQQVQSLFDKLKSSSGEAKNSTDGLKYLDLDKTVEKNGSGSAERTKSPDGQSANGSAAAERAKGLDNQSNIHDKKAGDPKFPDGSLDRPQLNKPGTVDREGFEQPASKKEDQSGPARNGEPTLRDKLSDKIVGRLSETERRAYDDETKRMEQHRQDVMKWGMSNIVPPPPYPKAPDTPLHGEVERRVREAESKITKDIRERMSPDERERLDSQSRDYDAARRRNFIKNPAGTGERNVPPVPGNAVKNYWDRVRDGVENF